MLNKMSETINKLITEGNSSTYYVDESDVCVKFTCDSADLLEWTHDYFACFIKRKNSDTATYNVLVSLNPKLFALLSDLSAAGCAQKTEYTSYKLESEEIWVQYQNNEVIAYYMSMDNGKSIFISLSPNTHLSRYIPMRVIRSKIIAECCSSGFTYFHSSCVARDAENGVAILGDRHAGKTSTMLNLVRNGFLLVANDKIAVRFNGIFRARGFPIAAGVRNGTIKAFPWLHNWLMSSDRQHYQMVNIASDERVYLTPTEVASACNSNIISQTRIKIIIVPKYIQGLQKAYIETIDRAEAIEILCNQVLITKTDLGIQGDLFINERQKRDLEYGTCQLIEEIVSYIPAFRLYQGERTNEYVPSLINKMLYELRVPVCL